MDVRFDDDDLKRLEQDPQYMGGRSVALVRQFRRLMNLIRRVPHEGELYKWPSRHFEKLSGKRKHQRSLRIDLNWRLIVEIEPKQSGGSLMAIKGIERHYKGKG